MRRAFIGDVHGCIDELKALYDSISFHTLDEVWCVGDLVDRGPDSGAVVQYCIDHNIPSIMGNHESSIIRLWDSHHLKGLKPNQVHKAKTLSQLTQEQIDYIRKFPNLHVFDDSNLVIVHGGLWPNIPLYAQPHNIIRAQLILPNEPNAPTRWFGSEAINHKCGKTEEESKQEGYRRWYEVYDHSINCIYGHSVFNQPLLHQNDNVGWTLGIDTGSCFGGMLTAVIIDNTNIKEFIAIKPKMAYCPDKLGKFLPR